MAKNPLLEEIRRERAAEAANGNPLLADILYDREIERSGRDATQPRDDAAPVVTPKRGISQAAQSDLFDVTFGSKPADPVNTTDPAFGRLKQQSNVGAAVESYQTDQADRQRRERQQAQGVGTGSIAETKAPEVSASSLIKGGVENFRQMGESVDQMVDDATGGAPWQTEAQKQARSDMQMRELRTSMARAAAARPEFKTMWGDALYSAGESIIQNLPGLVAGIGTTAVTGNPVLGGYVGAGVAGATSGTQAYGKYRERGATGGEAALGALGEGGVEAATELLPMGAFIEALGAKNAKGFLLNTGKELLTDVPGEQLATHLQDAIDTAIANPNKTWGDYFAERGDASVRTLITTIAQGAIMGGAGAAARKVAGPLRLSERPTAPGALESEIQGADVLTPEDEASPLPNEMIAAGKITAAEGVGRGKAGEILTAAGFPPLGTEVNIDMGERGTRRGKVVDAFETSTPEFGNDTGIKIELDDGTLFEEHSSTLRDMGVKISATAKSAEEIGDSMRRQAQEALAAGDAAVANMTVPAPAQPRSDAGEGVGSRGATPTPSTPAVTGNAAIAGFKAKTKRVESSGNPNAKNPRSSAEGLYQFTNGTFVRTYRLEYGKTGETDAQILAKKLDPKLQERLMDRLTKENADQLTRSGLAVTEGNLYLAHFAGSGGAVAILKANPNTPIEQILGDDAINANPFLKGKTAGQTAAWAAKKMGIDAPVPTSEGTYLPREQEEEFDPWAEPMQRLKEWSEREMNAPGTPVEQLETDFVEEGEAAGSQDLPKVETSIATGPSEAGSSPVDKAGGEVKETEDWQAFPADSGTLGIPRAEMPQIKSSDRSAMVQFLRARGIGSTEREVPAISLKATQAEYSPAKVEQAANYEGGNRRILVSSDGYILDGHHQALASAQRNLPIRTLELDAPISQLIDTVREMPSATTEDGATAAAQPGSAREALDGSNPTGSAQAAPAATPEIKISDRTGGKSILIEGASEAQLEAIKLAIPKALPGKATNGVVYAKKYEPQIRKALAAPISLEQQRASLKVTEPAPEIVAAARARADDPIGFKGMSGETGMAAGIGEGLRDALMRKVEAGDTTENGSPSAILQAAKKIKDAGGTVDRAMLDKIGAAVERARASNDFQKSMRDFVAEQTPARNQNDSRDLWRRADGTDTELDWDSTPRDERQAIRKAAGVTGSSAAPFADLSQADKQRIHWHLGKPKAATKKVLAKGGDTRMADYSGQDVRGDGNQDENGFKGSTKERFLADARSYLRAVDKLMTAAGYGALPDRKGKPGKTISVNEGGPAVSGEVSYSGFDSSGNGVWAQISSGSMNSFGGYSILARSATDSDRYGSRNGANQWMRGGMTAQELADKLIEIAESAKRAGEPKAARNQNDSRELAQLKDDNANGDLMDDGDVERMLDLSKKAQPRAGTSGLIEKMPGKRTNKEYEQQGWNAGLQGYSEYDNPYMETSTAWEKWLKGARAGAKSRMQDAQRKEFGSKAQQIARLQAMKDAGEPNGRITVAAERMPDVLQVDLDAVLEIEQPSPNRLVTDDRAAVLRARLKEKLNLNRLNSGIDPEVLAIGAELAVYHIEKGARQFQAFARAIAGDLGTNVEGLRQYLRAWYNSARDLMEDAGQSVAGMEQPDAVSAYMRDFSGWAGEPTASGGVNPTQNEATSAGPDAAQSPPRAASAPVEGRPASLNNSELSPSGERSGISNAEARDDLQRTDVGTDNPAGDAGSRTRDVSGADAGTEAVRGRGNAGEGSDGNVQPDGRASEGADPVVADGASGKRAGAEPSDAGRKGSRARRSNRVSDAGKPARADGGVDYSAPVGSLKREGGWRATAERNLDIIELVNRLDAEGRAATPEEQALLAKWTGWGAGEIRNNLFRNISRGKDGVREIIPASYGEWAATTKRAAELLKGDALETALQSTQYAHYTSEEVIRSIWTGLERLGFQHGRMLEPGMGSGLFAVAAPSDVMAKSQYTGIEFDAFTAKIASYLLPQENVISGDFIKQKLPDGFFDMAIGNPPFADVKVMDDPAYKRLRLSLHDYFFAKSIDKVRPGGIMAFVTSRYTMDKLNPKARAYLTERADLLGAIRLPQTAFKENAGTEVVTDVLFFQRRMPGAEPGGQAWGSSVPIKVDGTTHNINEYYVAHPEMVLGAHSTAGSMYRANEYTVKPAEGDIAAQFAKAIENLPKGVYQSAVAQAREDATAKAYERDMRPASEKEGGLYLKDGSLFVRDEGTGVPVTAPAKDLAWLKDYVGLRDALKQAQRDQLDNGDWEKSLAALNKSYTAFTKKHGPISAFTVYERTTTDDDGNEKTTTYKRFKNDKLLRLDVESPLVENLEKITDDGDIIKGPFLLGRTLNKPSRPQINSVQDALAVGLDEIGRLDLDYVAGLAGKDRAEVIEALGDGVFMAPSGEWQLADEYLSGDVVTKLEEARTAADLDPRFERNVKSLTEVQPKPLGASDISAKLGAGWIPERVIQKFAGEVLSIDTPISYEPATAEWAMDKRGMRSSYSRSITADFGTEDRSPTEIFLSVLNNQAQKITRKVDGKSFTDPEATAAAQEKARLLEEKFREWIWQDAARAQELIELYNRRFNNLAPRRFDGEHLTLPGLSANYSLYPHQKRAIWRAIQTGNTYFNHAVGAGKTLEMIVSGMEMRRLGLIKKPMYVVPNHMLNQFSREFIEAYPAANIMVADEKAFQGDNRKRFMARAALNDPDAIVITHSSFGKIGTAPESREAIVDSMVAELEAAKEGSEARHTRSKIEKQIESIKRKFEGKTGSEGKDQALTFEEMGVDFLFVDEAHEFRKLDFATNRQVKGIDPNGSQRALDLYIKTRWLEQQNPGRSLILASGTPVTNTMAEIYTVMRYMDEAGLERDGLRAFDAWANMFGEVAAGYEQNAAGGYEIVERFAKFVNVPELMKRVRTFMDVLTSEQLGDLVKRPKVNGGVPHSIVSPPIDTLDDYMKGELAQRIKVSRAWKPSKDQPSNPDPIIAINGDARLSSIDMRYINSRLPNDPGSKLNVMIDRIVETHKRISGIAYVNPKTGAKELIKGGTQIVFSSVGFGEQAMKNRGFDARGWLDGRLMEEAGLKKSEIAWMSDYNTHAKKEALFKDMRAGKVRVLIGSPKNMGTGLNVQNRLKALHYLSPPWYPSDVEQPHGRIVRQGNWNDDVDLYWYATKGTYDSTAWGMVSRKARFIEQAMSGDDSVRKLDDISEANQYEMAAALAAGDERVIQVAGLSSEITRLERLEGAHADEQRSLGYSKRDIEKYGIPAADKAIEGLETAIKARDPAAPFSVEIDGATFDKPGEAGEALIAKIEKHETGDVDVDLGKFQGKHRIVLEPARGGVDIALFIGGERFPIYRGEPSKNMTPTGLAQRISNIGPRLSGMLAEAKAKRAQYDTDLRAIDRKFGAPFAYAADLVEKVAERARLQSDMAAETKAAERAAAAQDAPEPVVTANSLERDAAVAVVEGDPEALRDALAARLDQLNLNPDVKLVVKNALDALGNGQRVKGQFQVYESAKTGELYGVIVASLQSDDPLGTVNHEFIHAVRTMGAFKPAEWSALVRRARQDADLLARIERDYAGSSEERLNQELVAELFREFAADGAVPAGFIRKAYARVREFLRALGQVLRGEGFTTAESVMRAIERGEIGQRPVEWQDMPSNPLDRTFNSQGGKTIYHGGTFDPANPPSMPLFTSTDPDVARAYARDRGRGMGRLSQFDYSPKKVASAADVDRIAAPIFGNIDEQSTFTMIDPAFSGADAERVLEGLRAEGFDAVEFSDFAIDSDFSEVPAIAIISPSAISNAQAAEPKGTFYSLAPADSGVAFSNPETEARWQDAKQGVTTADSWISKMQDWGQTGWDALTRHWINLPNLPKYAALQQKLRQIEAAPQASKERAVRMLEDMVKGFSREDLDLFTRKVVLDDLAWDAQNERELPFGLTPETMRAERAKVDQALQADPEKRVWQAVMKRKVVNRRVAQELVDAGVLDAEQIKNPAYYRHQVLEYARAQQREAMRLNGAAKRLRTPKWARRMGSSLDINANLLEAEFDWLHKAFTDIPVAQAIEWIKASEHNILDSLKTEARERNAAGLSDALGKAEDVVADPQSSQEEVDEAAAILDLYQQSGRNIAMGFKGLSDLIADDQIELPRSLEAAASRIVSGQRDGEAPFALLNWILDNKAEGTMYAAMIYKGIGQRNGLTRGLLGKAYIDPQSAQDLANRLAPEGYTTWQPDEGKLLFTAKTLPEHAMDSMLEQIDAPAGMDKEVFRQALMRAKDAMVMGGDKYAMILPQEVADTLNELRRVDTGIFTELAIKAPVRAWKRWVLINPRRFIKYNLNNTIGDLDAVLAGNPKLLRRVGQAGRELEAVMRRGAAPSERYQEAVARGVFDSGLSVQELGNVNDLAPFERFTDRSLTGFAKLPFVKAWAALQGVTTWRENVFRYAAYLDYVDRLESGEEQRSVGYGASVPRMIDAIPDLKDRGALLARDLIGDYGAISHLGAGLRQTAIPFWSWMEINTRRYWRLTHNAYEQGIAQGIATGTGLAITKGAAVTAGLAVRAALVYGLIQVWNHLMFGDEEDELDEAQQAQLHIILGRNEAGEIITLRTQGAMSDALSWFGIGATLGAFKEYERGRGSLAEVLAQPAKASANRILGSLSPEISLPVESLSGKKYWPDVFRPRELRDGWRNFADTFSLGNEYDAVMGNPTRGYGRSWQEAIIYRRDPGEMAYNEARSIAYEWNERVKGVEGFGGASTPRSKAMRNYRSALKFGDEEGATKALEQMAELGVTKGDYSGMVKRAAPLGPIAKKDRAAFIAGLNEDEAETFIRAEEWYRETFGVDPQ